MKGLGPKWKQEVAFDKVLCAVCIFHVMFVMFFNYALFVSKYAWVPVSPNLLVYINLHNLINMWLCLAIENDFNIFTGAASV